MQDFESMFDDLFCLEDAMDKYDWIMDYGSIYGNAGLAEADKKMENKVQGCTSSLWLVKRDDMVYCNSDSAIVNGFASMICDWWNQASEEQRVNFSLNTLMIAGLAPLLSMGRQNGIANLIARLKTL